MKTKIENGKRQKTAYGSYTPLYFEGNFRYDLYIPDARPQEEVIEDVMCLGHTDLSPVKTGRATYEERENCHCCFAGYAHTVNLCNGRNQNKNK